MIENTKPQSSPKTTIQLAMEKAGVSQKDAEANINIIEAARAKKILLEASKKAEQLEPIPPQD